jgi:hypothetical protein
MLHFVACAIAMHYAYSCGQINPQKATHQIYRIVARVSIAQWCQPYLSVFMGAHLLSMMLKKGFGRSSLKTSAIASNVVIVGVREAPCTTGISSKGQLQQRRVM